MLHQDAMVREDAGERSFRAVLSLAGLQSVIDALRRGGYGVIGPAVRDLYQMSAVHAVEHALGITVAEPLRALRRLNAEV